MRGFRLMLAAAVAGALLVHPLQGQQSGLVIENGTIVSLGELSSGVLVLVDGVEVTQSAIPQIELSRVERIEVIRGSVAEELYGGRATQGAILITMVPSASSAPLVPGGVIRIGPNYVINWNQAPDVLITLDGRISTRSEVAELRADAIEDIEVIRGAAAEQEYGSIAAGGVIIVTSRTP